jgi:hypothetical protein
VLFDGAGASGVADLIGWAAAAALVACVAALVLRRNEDGVRRWLRAGAYFSACLVASAAAGVLPVLLTGPLLGDGSLGDIGFVAALLGCVAVELVAYGWVWPRGTYTLDRPRDLPTGIGFGLAWGVTEAQLLLVLFALVEQSGWSKAYVVLVAFVLMSAFQGCWHALYWDRLVAPEHNDPRWNLRKVLLCHVPNLAATLTFLAVYSAPLLFVGLQALSLVLSSCAMHWPRPRPRVSTVSC